MTDPNDTAVDRAIARLEEAVAELKTSQAKDDAEEEPRTLEEARVRVREHFRRKHSSKVTPE